MSQRPYLWLTLTTAVLYAPLIHAQFVYDDAWVIVQNPAIRSITPWRFFAESQTGALPASGLTTDVYRPLTVLAFAVDHALWGFRPLPYHLENVVWHLLAGFIFWNLLKRLLKNEAGALFGTAVFLWHPVQVQTVAWVTQRANVMGTSAMLAALWCFLRFPGSSTALASGVILYLAAMFSKESTIVLPGLLLLVEGVTRREALRGRHALVKYVSLGLAAAAYLLLRYSRLHQWTQFAGVAKEWGSDLALGTLGFCVYLGKLLFPVHLRPSYDYPALRALTLAGACVVCLVFFSVWVRSLRRSPVWTMGLGWIGLGLLPVLQIFPIRAFVAERFLYVPVMGLALLTGGLFAQGTRARILLGAWLAFLAASTAFAVRPWTSDRALWANAVRQEPTNAFAHLCNAQYAESPEAEEASYKNALMNRPTESARFTAINNLAWLYLQQNSPRKALFWARKAVALEPKDPHALYNLRRASEKLKTYRRAGR